MENQIVQDVSTAPRTSTTTTDSSPPSCRKCGHRQPEPSRKFCHHCEQLLTDGLRSIPIIYRKLRPIVPVESQPNKPFVVILGPCGVGKSVAAAELLQRHAIQTGQVPSWFNVPTLLLSIRSTFDSKRDSEQGFIKSVVRKRWICLDDLGTEKVTDYSTSTLYIILNSRGENGDQTVITSNLSLEQIAEKLDDRIANRLARYGHVVTLTKNNVRSTQVEPIGGEEYREIELRDAKPY